MAAKKKSKPLSVEYDHSSSSKKSIEQNQREHLIEDGSLLTAVFEASPNVINVYTVIRDQTGKVIDFECSLLNENARRFGINIGDRWSEKYSGAFNDGLFTRLTRVVEEDIIANFEHHSNHNSTENWQHIIAVKVNGSLVVTSEDITLRKKVEKEIDIQHTLLTQAEELAQAGSWDYSIDTSEFLWSDGMYRLFEMKKGSLVNPDVYLKYAVDGDIPVAGKIVNAIRENFQAFEETLNIICNGSVKTIKVKGAPLKNEAGKPDKMLGVDVDITKVKQSEEKVMELNKSLVAMNQELNSLNSELKNFNSITANNYSETLRHIYINLEAIVTNDARSLSDSSRANLRRAQSGIQRLKLLTNDINNYLQFYDLGIQKIMINPNNIIENVLSAMKGKIEDAQVTIKIIDLPSFPADPLLFSHLITNLLDNAIKFRKLVADTVIKIHYSHADELNAMSKASKETPYMIIIVSDNGIGFQPNELDKIFELFYQIPTEGKHKGSGMGLAICKKIMEMHGGFIAAESERATGTSFQCYFPL